MRIKVTEEDGTATTFKKAANLAANQKVWEWITDTVSEGNATGTSTVVSGKLTTATYTAWDQAKGATGTVPIAEYGYDGTGIDAKLLTVKDSRTGDTTTYTYGADSATGVPLIASSTERAQGGALVDAPTFYEYGMGNNTAGRADWLEVVKRGNPTMGACIPKHAEQRGCLEPGEVSGSSSTPGWRGEPVNLL